MDLIPTLTAPSFHHMIRIDSEIVHIPGAAGHAIEFGIRERANARFLDVHTVHFTSPVLSLGGPFRFRRETVAYSRLRRCDAKHTLSDQGDC